MRKFIFMTGTAVALALAGAAVAEPVDEKLVIDGEIEIVTKGRHDPCVGIRATPIVEAMMALVLMDQALRHRAQCGDVGEVGPNIPGA